ncbi:IgGFc-binding protein-like [Discoglossus pictus]
MQELITRFSLEDVWREQNSGASDGFTDVKNMSFYWFDMQIGFIKGQSLSNFSVYNTPESALEIPCNKGDSKSSMLQRLDFCLDFILDTIKCPENSHYEACGSACPASCSDKTAPDTCTEACVETCQCNKGYVLSSDKCVPSTSCGCNHNGLYYEPNEEFWSDESCSTYCRCDPASGKVVCSQRKCKSNERCKIVNGKRGCHPSSYSTCTASGAHHYTTFDGLKFDFMGTSIYKLVTVTAADPTLTPFMVTVENNNRGNKAVSFTKVVAFEVYNQTIIISKDYPGQILVNGIQTALPYNYENDKMTAFIRGLNVEISTDFDFTVTFNWDSYARVILPATYANSVSGLCGNSNHDQADDFIMSNGVKTQSATEFGESWTVGRITESRNACVGNCLTCKEENKEQYKNDQYCGIITKANGPFINCHESVDPTPFFNDCVFDTCYFQGQPFAFSSVISNYAAACQTAGILIQEWRSSSFAYLVCPPNSHYELCGTGCVPSCYDLSTPMTCEPSCTEGCYCNNGFILSGSNCVPIAQCGCAHKGIYYEKGKQFYTDDTCTEWCKCQGNGIMTCESLPCGPLDQCKVENGVRGCQSERCSKCTIMGAHYISFDGLAYDFQGTCSYTLATLSVQDPRLVKFSVMVEMDNNNVGQLPVQKMVKVSVNGKEFSFERGRQWKVFVDKEIYTLPLNYPDKKIWINQEGNNIIFQTDFGLKVLYDTEYTVIVQITGSYWNKIRGLCGNYNDDLTDELMLPDGSITQNIETFGSSWKVTLEGVQCNDGCGDTCPVLDLKESAESTKGTKCGIIKSQSGPFKGCFSKVNPLRYFKNCVYDLTMSGDVNALCRSVQAYVTVCQAAGGVINTWRTETFCPLTCKNLGRYDLCTRTCDHTCAQVAVPYSCTARCFEGCKCLEGEYFSGKQCVPMEECGSVNQERYMQVEESVVSSDCSEKCTCLAGGAVSCEALNCSENESCTLRNGQRGCSTGEGQCTIGPKSIVTTFDEFSLPISANEAHEISSLCDKNSPNWFRVVQIPGLSYEDQSVFVFFKNLNVSSNMENKIWVDGSPVKLPTVAPGDISLSSTEDGLLIKQPAGVKVLVSTSGEVTVKVPQSLSNRLCGACGNFNGISDDDDEDSP